MSGDSLQYQSSRPSRAQQAQAMASQLAYEEYSNAPRSNNPTPMNSHPFKEDYNHYDESSQPAGGGGHTRQQAYPFSHHPHAGVSMMAATASYDERTGMRSYRYNPANSPPANPAEMPGGATGYHPHPPYSAEGYEGYPYPSGGTPGGAGAGPTSNGDGQSQPNCPSPSNSERQRGRRAGHHRSNSNPQQIEGVHHRRTNSEEQQDPQSNRSSQDQAEWANNPNNHPYINRYHQSQQQAIAAYHAHHQIRDDATTTSNSSSSNNYHNHQNPRGHPHLHHLHHPNNPPAYPNPYESMDVDPPSQNGNPNTLPPTGYDDLSNQHAHQQQLQALQYGYESQYASAAALAQQQQPSFIPPPNYRTAPNRIKTDSSDTAPQNGSNMEVFVSPSSSEQKPVISPTMSSATATTNASTCTFGSGKDSQSHMHSHYHQDQGYRNNQDGGRMVSIGGGVVGMSDRKQMQSQAWYERFRELREYKESMGNCMVPQKYEPNPSLGIWVNKQRMEYKLLQDGEKSSMTPERLSALQSIGFVWAKRKGQATWDAKYKQLQEYKSRHGDCLIPTKFAKDPALGRWVSTQREQYRLWKAGDDRSKMTVEKVRMLEEVGFVWRLQF